MTADAERGGREFAARYQECASALLAWARLRLPGALRGRLEPEELIQEVWLRAWRRWRDFDAAKGSFRAWVFGIARNVLREGLEEMLGRGRAQSDFDLVPETVADELTTISRRARKDEFLSTFCERLGELEEADRKLVMLRGLEGKPHEEIAQRLGVGVNVAEKRWSRLRERLEVLRPPAGLFADL